MEKPASEQRATPIQGLPEREVLTRRARGQGNDVRYQTSRSYAQILRQHAFTSINIVLFAIGIVLVLMGRWGDALVTAGLVLLYVAVAVVQEGRAKRKLDRIALLTRPQATVIRAGRERTIDPSEIVLGDVLVVRPGDQIVVDGQVLGDERVRMDVDESLLTGESDPVPKQTGDPVYSGSFCVTGSAAYEAQKVGDDCLANQMTAGARAFRQVKTPLQQDVDFVIRVLVFLVSQLGILLAISFAMKNVPVVETVKMAAVVVALVPQGLLVAVTVAYTMGVVRMAGRGVLIQQLNAVESLSHVNVLCLDKTGTLTTNRIQLHAIHPLGTSEPELARTLGDYVASTSEDNRTADAIGAAFDGQARRVREEVPFSSARQWSALSFDDDALHGTYVLGAPETLQPHLRSSSQGGQAGVDLRPQVHAWIARGLRVLLFAYHSEVVLLHDARNTPQLPSGLTPLGILSFSDELRPEAQETLTAFAEAGIQLKIISGDNPHAVAALARQVGLGSNIRVISGADLAELDDASLAQVVEETTIFGRITPQQKEKLVRALRGKGCYVAMIGDGVNDVLSLKQAQLGIAMQSGCQATRSVADMVLLADSFAALPTAFREGQRIIRGMQDVVRLLLTRTLYVISLIVATAVAAVAFPITPKHNSILALLTVGIPTLTLAAWARPGKPPRSLLRSVVHFVFPAAFTVAVVALTVYLFYLLNTNSVDIARTALTTITVLCGLVLIPFVEPPTPAWVGGDELSGDWRPTFLALGMLVLFGAIMLVPALREAFELTSLQWLDFLLIGIVVGVWGIALRLIWRVRLFERLLNRR
jgi:cation-transporting ATPase E